MPSSREFPERPIVGVGGVVIEGDRALLIRRASEPLRGEWSIPGGMLELGETLEEGAVRELQEETGLRVRVLELIEVFERIVYAPAQPQADPNAVIAAVDATTDAASKERQLPTPRYHYVIVDYLCERISGQPVAASDVTDVAFAREEELPRFHLTETALRILHKAFALDRQRRSFR
jgi:8-oxo-dGTP diphosphatase